MCEYRMADGFPTEVIDLKNDHTKCQRKWTICGVATSEQIDLDIFVLCHSEFE